MTDTPVDYDDDVFIHFTFETKLIRIIENILLPTKLSIRAEVITGDATDDEIDLAFTKIKHWFDQIVSRTLVFDSANASALNMVIDGDGSNRTGNLLMLTPFDPTDDNLAILFQAKMTALAAGAFSIGPLEVRSDNLIGLHFTYVGFAEDALPEMAEWMGERQYFAKPWWARNDASTLDIVPPEDADLTKPPSWAYSLDYLGRPAADTQPGGTVVRPAFRPTVIEGGKE